MKKTTGEDFAVGNIFTDGNAGGGIPATVVDSDWLNVVQAELVAVLTAANVTIDQAHDYAGSPPNDTTQLTQSIRKLALKMSGWDAITGAAAHCTHANLAAALADSAIVAGMRIRVDESESVGTTITISKSNLYIEFKPLVNFTKTSSPTKCLSITGDSNKIVGGRFVGFSTGGNIGIELAVGADYNQLWGQTFNTCDTAINDLATTNSIVGTIQE